MKLYIGADCKITMSVTDKSAIVQLFPTANARGIVSVNNDRCQYIARCWNGFKYHVEIFGYSPSDEAGKVAAKEKAEVYLAENSSNNIYDPIEVEFKDITEDIAKDFRYIQSSIDYDVQKVEIDARWMGMWLTKGADDLPVIKVKDPELIEYIKSVDITKFKTMKLTKRIPEIYMANSKEIRLELLGGIIDSIGQLDKTVYDVVLKSEYLASGLGFFSQIVDKVVSGTYVYKRVKIYNTYHTPKITVLVSKKNFDISKAGVVQYPPISLVKDGKQKSNVWTDEMKAKFHDIALKYTQNNRVQWKEMVKNESLYSHVTSNALHAYHVANS